ncbi:MAG: FAD-dependent oxidoreductase [Lachnospiraceae bacterium]|nr:FAD-dependent oxidoreductase [Lachnospiraceae bacterium]
MLDMIIIGSGPAGLSAAVYAKRAGLNSLVIEKEYVSGGQVLLTYEVDNYLGLPGMNGFDLGTKFREHADGAGANFATDRVVSIEACQDADGKPFYCVKGTSETYEARTLVAATGTVHRLLGVPGEDRFTGKGVSYCATCDGAFFKKKEVAVVGGGDVAVEDAIYLARLCSKVTLIHRRDRLRAAKSLQDCLFALDNVEVVWNANVTEVQGDKKVENIIITSNSGASVAYPVDGLFIAVGITPVSECFRGLVAMDEAGYIIAGEDCTTSAPGVFVAGDLRTKKLRQIVTAVADGAVAVSMAGNYLESL